MQLKDIASFAVTTAPVLEEPAHDVRSDIPPVQSNHPDVQELIVRFNDNQEMDCPALDRGDLALVGAIYMEVVDDPNFHPTSHILTLIRTLNAQMQRSSGKLVA